MELKEVICVQPNIYKKRYRWKKLVCANKAECNKKLADIKAWAAGKVAKEETRFLTKDRLEYQMGWCEGHKQAIRQTLDNIQKG
ncbi:MAG: hypothetical protein HQ579_02920 [Candidatus Omnitrophica bacterium]|nr:hypothetical protein [Candidatus Omnitrophota bacterium]